MILTSVQNLPMVDLQSLQAHFQSICETFIVALPRRCVLVLCTVELKNVQHPEHVYWLGRVQPVLRQVLPQHHFYSRLDAKEGVIFPMYRTRSSPVNVQIFICQRQQIVRFYNNDILEALWRPGENERNGCGSSQRWVGLKIATQNNLLR